jgi:hypothetical protein
MANRINPSSESDIPERHRLSAKFMNAIIEKCEESKLRIRGHSVIEDGNGNYMVWFTDAGKYFLYALVNERFENIFCIDATTENMAELQKKLDELKEELEP